MELCPTVSLRYDNHRGTQKSKQPTCRPPFHSSLLVPAKATMKYFSFLALLSVKWAAGFAPTRSVATSQVGPSRLSKTIELTPGPLFGMKRPILDTVASSLFQLETSRVEASSELDEQGRRGEPMAWSESSSLANQFSEAMASNSLGYQFKQFVADIVAGDYDEDAVTAKVEAFIQDNSKIGGNNPFQKPSPGVAMFSFTTCPFCRRAKDYLDEKGVAYSIIELDELEGNEGNEIRAVLGKLTKRTSVPSIFVGGTYIGGCNDGPGLLPLGESGELDKLLQRA